MGEGGDVSKEQVLRRDVPWETYMTAKLISGTDLQLLRRYDHRAPEVQAALLAEDGPAYVRTFLAVLRNVTKEETVEYALALVEDALAASPKHAALFHDPALAGEDVYGPFLRLLSRKSWFTLEKSAKILTLVISARPSKHAAPLPAPAMPAANGVDSSSAARGQSMEDIQRTLVEWLCGQLKQPAHAARAIPTAVSALATLLREVPVRAMFVSADGVKLLAPLLSPASSQQYMQLLYETALCVWLLSFHDAAVNAIANTRILPRLIEVVKTSTKEKVVRVAVLTFKNLMPKGSFGNTMVELGLPKLVASLQLHAWVDEDLREALRVLEEGLKLNIKTLSSFDKYKQEVLRVLVTLLDSSRDSRTLAVACYDVGQFIQVHPAGRGIVSDLKAKERVLKHMAHPDPEVQKQALMCVQKLLLSSKYVNYLQ
eukprot:SM000093S24386  [mRNA]  locus=s93:12370:15155:+ [translate_table: standard]